MDDDSQRPVKWCDVRRNPAEPTPQILLWTVTVRCDDGILKLSHWHQVTQYM